MDVQASKVFQVSLSLASAIEPTSEMYSFSSQQTTPSANNVLFRALTQHARLDRFANIVGFLACADKLSTSVDCFRALDEVASTVFRVFAATESKTGTATGAGAGEVMATSPYGVPELNPEGTLGLGLWYWQRKRVVADSKVGEDLFTEGLERNEFQKYMVKWSIRAQSQAKDGSGNPKQQDKKGRPQSEQSRFAARYSTDWMSPMVSLSSDTGLVESWNEPEVQPDQKAEFVLLLDPPVYLPYTRAEALGATSTASSKTADDFLLNNLCTTLTRTVHRIDGEQTKLDVNFTSLVSYQFVKTTEIPIAHPRDLPEIFTELRKAVLLESLCSSLDLDALGQDDDGEDEDEDDDDEALDSELMLIDTLLEKGDLPPQVQHGWQVNVSLVEERSETFILVNAANLHDLAFRVKPTLKTGNGSHAVELEVSDVGFGQMAAGEVPAGVDLDLDQFKTKLAKVLTVTEDLAITLVYTAQVLGVSV